MGANINTLFETANKIFLFLFFPFEESIK